MCDLNRCMEEIGAHFAALFDVPPKALGVRQKGASLWCNAPLQYASKCGVTVQEAADYMICHAPKLSYLTLWQTLPNGMLQARFKQEILLQAAKTFCVPRKAVSVSESNEPLFFEKCIAIRAQHVLKEPDFSASLSLEDQDIVADALCLRQVKQSDIVRTANLLEQRLDQTLKTRDTYDIVCHVLLSALQMQLESIE